MIQPSFAKVTTIYLIIINLYAVFKMERYFICDTAVSYTHLHELAMTMVREVLYNTGITATAGIGTNLRCV